MCETDNCAPSNVGRLKLKWKLRSQKESECLRVLERKSLPVMLSLSSFRTTYKTTVILILEPRMSQGFSAGSHLYTHGSEQ